MEKVLKGKIVADAINQGIENASDAVIDYLDHGFNHAMNRFN